MELETRTDLEEHLAAGRGLAGWSLQSLDLRGLTEAVIEAAPRRTLMLGCTLDPGAEPRLQAAGALLFPRLPDLPFNPYRSGLYTADELYLGLDRGYLDTPDGLTYQWWREHHGNGRLGDELAMALHDHAIMEAFDDLGLTGPVGIMGGHNWERGGEGFTSAARLARWLVEAGHQILTGGGPGAMEAANLGASLVGTEEDLAEAIRLLAGRPRYAEGVGPWAEAGMEVRRRWQVDGPSYGVPTWLYGHEPPNGFGVGIAKLFSNALREDILLRRASAGVVCLPGAAGTVQEIFQAITPRYYAVTAEVPPLILVGSSHWRDKLPAWPLVQALASRGPLSRAVHLVDKVDEIPALLAS